MNTAFLNPHRRWLSLACSVKIVSSISEAIAFANEHGSHHTDAIVTESGASARAFCAGVDSAGVVGPFFLSLLEH